MTQSTMTINARPSRALSIGLWIIQILLAVVYLAHGLMMLFPPAELAELALRLFIGVAELAAVAGLIGPGLTKLLPFGTALTAICLSVLMTLATITHITRGEYSSAFTCIILLALAAFLAYARIKLLPIQGRAK
jgi:putative oxidoreductase